MKFKLLTLYTTICCVLVVVSSANAQPNLPSTTLNQVTHNTPPPREKIDPKTLRAETKGAYNQATGQTTKTKKVYYEKEGNTSQKAIYIIQLTDKPLATYTGGVAGFRATSPRATGEHKLNARSNASRAYRGYLGTKHAEFKQAAAKELGQSLTVLYDYDVTFNGLAILATPQEAAKLLKLDNVLTIQRDQWRYPATNDSGNFLGVPGVWDGSGTGKAGTKGEGVIVGVIDSGIWPEHPSFKDDGTFPAPPATWPKTGVCDAPKATADVDGKTPFDPYGYKCNNKLIGVQYFLAGYSTNGYDGLFYSGRDDDGHGTHTASTSAGNENVPVSMYGINRGKISGMAPRAYIAAYKGLGPGGGTGADLTAAINKAVEDGVDVINYSVGSDFASDPWVDADAQAYLAAREAGVFVATSAGNDGTNGSSTVGSPGNSPWVMTVGASAFNRLYLSDLVITSTGALTAPTGLYGATMTAGITNFNLVDPKGVEDSAGDTSGACLNPFKPGTFQATDVVLCPRGGVSSSIKGHYVNLGGAGAIIAYNNATNYDLMSGLHLIPTVYMYQKDALILKDYVKNHPGNVSVSFTVGEKTFAPADPRVPVDTVVGFSSRGPNINENNGEFINNIKPDVTAPGLNILAGASPEYGTNNGVEGRIELQGQLFQNIQGTSMSSPHVAGLGALMKALYPKWSPAQIQSALMSTAVNTNQKARFSETDDRPATAFDMGAGRVDMRTAPKAGFVLDETAANYQAANPTEGGDPANLNMPSLAQGKCVGECYWTRKIQSTMNVDVDWTVTLTGAMAANVSVQPSSFTLKANGEVTLNFTATTTGLPLDTWAFADVWFTPNNANAVAAHFPMTIKPMAGVAPMAEVNIDTRRNKGTSTIQGVKSLASNSLQAVAYTGVPTLTMEAIAEDSDNGDAYDDLTDGVYVQTFEVPVGSKGAVVEILDSTADDMDMYVGVDTNGDGEPSADEELCASTSGSWNEICTFPQVGEPLQTGTYWVLVQNWAGSGAATDDFTLSITVVSNTPSTEIILSAPSTVAQNVPFNINVAWDIPTFVEGDRKFAIVEIGTSASNPTDVASLSLNLNRVADDLSIASDVMAAYVLPGDTIEYTVNIQPEVTVKADSIKYDFTATLPPGLTYVEGSASVTPTQINGQKLSWSVDVPTSGKYVMTTNETDSSCDTVFGGYVDLADFNIEPREVISGNNVVYSFNELRQDNDPVNFYGMSFAKGFYFTDDGFASFNQDLGNRANVTIPNAAAPNNLVAPFWRDLSIVYDKDNSRGVLIAASGAGRYMVTQYSGVEPSPVGSTNDRYNFEIVMDRQVDDAPGAYEIVFAYDNMTGTVASATVGIENADASKFVAVPTTEVKKGAMICFDYSTSTKATFRAKVDAAVARPAELAVTVDHTIPGSSLLTTTSDVVSVPDTLLEISLNAPRVITKGNNIEYTFTVSNTGVVAANNLKVVTNLPGGTTHVSGGQVMTGEVVFEGLSVPAGGTTQVKLVVKPNIMTLPVTSTQTTAERDARIIGGIEAKSGAWPWQVALVHSGVANGFDAQFCGGSLIAPDLVVTAAHCVEDETIDSVEVVAGRLVLSSDEGQQVQVSQIVQHAGYTPDLALPDNDIALLRLAEPVELTTTVQPIGLLTAANEATLAAPNTISVVTGWGDTSNGGRKYSDELRQVTVPIVSNETCSAAYDALNYDPGSITPNMVCAGFVEGGKDACYGDSGGPLVVSDGHGGWIQLGVVSSGDECAQPEAYGTYTRVAKYTDWLEEAMNTYEITYYYVTDGTNKVGHWANGDTLNTNTLTQVKDSTKGIYLPLLIRTNSVTTTQK